MKMLLAVAMMKVATFLVDRAEAMVIKAEAEELYRELRLELAGATK